MPCSGRFVATFSLVVCGVSVPIPHTAVVEIVRERREAAHPTAATDQKRCAVIYNPVKVTDWVVFRRHVEYELKTRGWARPLWLETTIDDPGRAQTAQAVAEGVDLVVGAGGDGTVRVICSGLAGTGIPFGVVAAGTSNLLARNLGIPRDEAAALRVAFDGADKAIDLVRLTADGRTRRALRGDGRRGHRRGDHAGHQPGPEEDGRLGRLLRVRGQERQPPRRCTPPSGSTTSRCCGAGRR